MSKKLYEESNIQDIASAIREKNGTQNQYTVAQMPAAIRAIETQPDLEVLNVTENGNYLPSAGKDGFSSVNVSVEGGGGAVVQPLNATQNGAYNPPSGVDGYAPVTVNVQGGSGNYVNYVNNCLKNSEFFDAWIENNSVTSVSFNSSTGDIVQHFMGGSLIGVRYKLYTVVDASQFTSFHYKITTGSNSYDTSLRFAPGIGIVPKEYFLSILNRNEISPTNNTYMLLSYVYTQNRNDIIEGSFDLTNITGPICILPFAAGWDVTFSELYFS